MYKRALNNILEKYQHRLFLQSELLQDQSQATIGDYLRYNELDAVVKTIKIRLNRL